MFSPYNKYGWLAQSVEQQAVNLRVGGSSPSLFASKKGKSSYTQGFLLTLYYLVIAEVEFAP